VREREKERQKQRETERDRHRGETVRETDHPTYSIISSSQGKKTVIGWLGIS
jgi:hypothetical protein